MRSSRGVYGLGLVVAVLGLALAAFGTAEAGGDGVKRATALRAEPATVLAAEHQRRPVQAGGIDIQVPQGGGGTTEGLFDALTPAQVVAMLKSLGREPEDKTDKDQPIYKIKLANLNVLMFLYNKQKDGEGYLSGSLSCGFNMTDKPTLAVINKWNLDKRFTKAYLNDEGNPRLEMDFVFVGCSAKNFKEYMGLFEASLKSYVKHIGFEK